MRTYYAIKMDNDLYSSFDQEEVGIVGNYSTDLKLADLYEDKGEAIQKAIGINQGHLDDFQIWSNEKAVSVVKVLMTDPVFEFDLT